MHVRVVWLSWLIALWLSPSAICRASSPDSIIVDAAKYPDSAAVEAAWLPMRGSPAAAIGTVDGRPALRFPCLFGSAGLERASWDWKVHLDLSACRGVELKVLCRDATPVSYFS